MPEPSKLDHLNEKFGDYLESLTQTEKLQLLIVISLAICSPTAEPPSLLAHSSDLPQPITDRVMESLEILEGSDRTSLITLMGELTVLLRP